jgi:hypothetical protein
MKDVKTYVSNNMATVICPACNKNKRVNAEPYENKKHAIKVRCGCGEVFNLHLDFRGHYRKDTKLPGTYSITTPGKESGGVIHIRNISRSGIGFTVTGLHNLGKDMLLTLDFHLDDKNHTELQIEAIVCTVSDNAIGCRFTDSSIVSETALGFYLQP